MKYTDFPIRGIDVSYYDGNITWNETKNYPVYFAIIRSGYGKTTDTKFVVNWNNSKEKVHRSTYWYMDYYSNTIPDAEWGRAQADHCWNLIKDDNDKGLVWLDIESGGSYYSPPIQTVWTKAETIAKAFLKRIDELSGRTNGIYCSLSMLSLFSSWFRTRPLWVAWYNEYQTPLSVKYYVRLYGWAGDCLLWQYASDADTDDDGMGEGILMGLGRKIGDLDIWIGTPTQWDEYSNGWEIPMPPPIDPLYNVEVIAGSLNVRYGPGTNYSIVTTITKGTICSIYVETNGWGKISSTENMWISLNSLYVKKLTGDPPPPSLETWKVTAPTGLNIRSVSSTSYDKIGTLVYNQIFQIESITNGWGKLYGRAGYVSLAYAIKI